MLVLSRKLGESIVIDGDIVLTVTAIQGSRVKISVQAPKSRRVMRGEIAGDVRSPALPRTEANWTDNGTDVIKSAGTTQLSNVQ